MEQRQKTLLGTFSEYFKEVIYGGIDGIVTTFAVVAGFAGAALSTDTTVQISFMVVLLFGLANLFADAASMGLGNFLSVRSEKDLYRAERKKELQLLHDNREGKLVETKVLLEERGFTGEQADSLVRLYMENENYWLEFMMKNGKDMSDPTGDNEILTGFATFVSFMIFGAVPLLPFMIETSGNPSIAFGYSVLGTFIALSLLGILKWKVVGDRLFSSLAEVVLVGGTAAVLAYFVGTFFAL